MALNPNIPLSGAQPNPLGAIFEAEGIKGKRASRAATEQSIDQKGREMEIQSMLDGAVMFGEYLSKGDVEGAIRAGESRAKSIQARGDNASNTMAFVDALKEGRVDEAKADVDSAINFGLKTGRLKSPGGQAPAGVQEFQYLLGAAGLEGDEEKARDAALIKLGLKAKEGTLTRDERAAYDQLLADKIAENKGQEARATAGGKELGELETRAENVDTIAQTESQIAQEKKFGELTGKARGEAIDTGIEEITKAEANIQNLEEAWQALEDGAESGPIISKWTPSIREETVRLNNVRSKLGLDVVGAVTFGALSKGELDIALATALPDLPPKELQQWIRDRQEAKRKLINYYDEQIEFIDGGGTVAEFRKMKRAERRRNNQQQGGTQDNEINSLVDQYAD